MCKIGAQEKYRGWPFFFVKMYVAGAFAAEEELDDSIVEHAAALGIPRNRIHFFDRHKERDRAYSLKVYPLMTGDRMYRDSNMREVDRRPKKKSSS